MNHWIPDQSADTTQEATADTDSWVKPQMKMLWNVDSNIQRSAPGGSIMVQISQAAERVKSVGNIIL